MIFDTHAHYDDEAFDSDREQLLAGLPEAGIGRVVNIAASPRSIDECLDLAHRFPHVYCALGIHPEHCAEMTEELLDQVITPIGLSIGAETPAEIAVSIAAQMIAHRAGADVKKGWKA